MCVDTDEINLELRRVKCGPHGVFSKTPWRWCFPISDAIQSSLRDVPRLERIREKRANRDVIARAGAFLKKNWLQSLSFEPSGAKFEAAAEWGVSECRRLRLSRYRARERTFSRARVYLAGRWSTPRGSTPARPPASASRSSPSFCARRAKRAAASEGLVENSGEFSERQSARRDSSLDSDTSDSDFERERRERKKTLFRAGRRAERGRERVGPRGVLRCRLFSLSREVHCCLSRALSLSREREHAACTRVSSLAWRRRSEPPPPGRPGARRLCRPIRPQFLFLLE